mmetsp:Transcript_13115/g.34300  ORF Transcript_13115/g.34300 Transcript_13115/m.34300 type:complete len:214 (-) Transcript_13115:35-676(-)
MLIVGRAWSGRNTAFLICMRSTTPPFASDVASLNTRTRGSMPGGWSNSPATCLIIFFMSAPSFSLAILTSDLSLSDMRCICSNIDSSCSILPISSIASPIAIRSSHKYTSLSSVLSPVSSTSFSTCPLSFSLSRASIFCLASLSLLTLPILNSLFAEGAIFDVEGNSQYCFTSSASMLYVSMLSTKALSLLFAACRCFSLSSPIICCRITPSK